RSSATPPSNSRIDIHPAAISIMRWEIDPVWSLAGGAVLEASSPAVPFISAATTDALLSVPGLPVLSLLLPSLSVPGPAISATSVARGFGRIVEAVAEAANGGDHIRAQFFAD